MKSLIVIILIVIMLVFLEIKHELSYFKTVQYELNMPGIRRDRSILFLSDLHNHMYGENNQKLFQAVCDARPDMILIGGDMLVGKNGHECESTLAFIKRLPEICPVYYANGNHEQRMKEEPEQYELSYEEYHKELQDSGVQFLENCSDDLVWDDVKVRITGLEIPRRCYTHFHTETMETEELTERIGEKIPGVYEILLAHNPSYMRQYLQRGADLILSGHLHGGIVRIPGVAGVISPSFEIFPKYSGDLYHEEDTDIVVSKGLGTHTINIRLFNPAELIVLKFKGEE